ncbi:MAG: hypothetical protein HEQ35_23655 [Gloeotrichia echinulata IR180]|jgi:hypothetical protein
MNILKTIPLFLVTILVSCSYNPINSKNNSISNNTVSVTSSPSTSISKDDLFIKTVREDVVNNYKKSVTDKPLLKIDLATQLKYTEDTDLINAGKLSCKVLDNITANDDKFEKIRMRGIAKDTKHPGVYTKIREYLDPQLKFNQKDLDYMSLNNIQQIQFLGLVPHFLADSVLNNSIKYYCPEKS